MAPLATWGLAEVALGGGLPGLANPFTDATLFATFTHPDDPAPRTVRGFYDGADTWRVRFMPSLSGAWAYTTRSNVGALNGQNGTILAVPPPPPSATEPSTAPVRVTGERTLGRADGETFFSVGTTAYAWVHQDDGLIAQTLDTLRAAPFNKVDRAARARLMRTPRPLFAPPPRPRHVAGAHDDLSKVVPLQPRRAHPLPVRARHADHDARGRRRPPRWRVHAARG